MRQLRGGTATAYRGFVSQVAPPRDDPAFPGWLKATREATAPRLTQREIAAELVGLDDPVRAYWRYENGKAVPTEENYRRIIERLDAEASPRTTLADEVRGLREDVADLATILLSRLPRLPGLAELDLGELPTTLPDETETREAIRRLRHRADTRDGRDVAEHG